MITMEPEPKEAAPAEQDKHKNVRHRKKHKFNAIRDQMEFYFSDANLTKDRYLGQLIKDNPYVPLQEFLKFNKIKKLTDAIADIVKALKDSKLLEVSEDELQVKRITEVRERKDIEERTIYVESIPPTADHDWVRTVFSAYGKVAYVSLPKYKFSRKIKEFGFIEFEDEECVQKVLNGFKAFGGVLTFDKAEPEKLMSVTSFIKEQKEVKNVDIKDVEQKLNISSEKEDEEPPTKKVKTDESESEAKESGGLETESDNAKEEEEMNTEEKAAADGEQKKKRRRKKGGSGPKKTIQNDDKVYELKIMTKADWRRLRNKYLNMQRESAKRIKQIFQQANFKKTQKKETNLNLRSVESSPRNINFYGVQDQQQIAPEEPKPVPKKPMAVAFEPGLIVNIKFREPCVDIKDFKAELKQYSYVKYVDLKEGALEAFIRVDKPSSANSLVKEYTMVEYTSHILSGETETTYWDRIKKDREDKLNKVVKVEKTITRGRTKLVKKIASHIKFEDD